MQYKIPLPPPTLSVLESNLEKILKCRKNMLRHVYLEASYSVDRVTRFAG